MVRRATYLPSFWYCFHVSPSAFAKWSSTDISFSSLCSVIITCFCGWGDGTVGAGAKVGDCCAGSCAVIGGDGVVGGVEMAWLCLAASIAWWCWWIWCFLWCLSLSMLCCCCCCCCWAWSAAACCSACCFWTMICCSSIILCFCNASCSCSSLLRIMRS